MGVGLRVHLRLRLRLVSSRLVPSEEKEREGNAPKQGIWPYQYGKSSGQKVPCSGPADNDGPTTTRHEGSETRHRGRD